MQDHYEVLGIEESATLGEIKAAWRRANSRAHPDREGGSHEAQARVNEAYRILSDPEERAAYDSGLESAIADPKMAWAREFLATVFLAVLTQAPEGLNLVEDTFRMLAEHRAEHVRSLTEQRRTLSQLVRRSNALLFKGQGIDYLKAAVEQRMSQLREAIEANTKMIERIDGAHEILRDYEFKVAAGGQAPTIWDQIDRPKAIPARRFAIQWPEGS
jgi:curved DNA-binding protein CbpA